MFVASLRSEAVYSLMESGRKHFSEQIERSEQIF